jgi:hypothetical protein
MQKQNRSDSVKSGRAGATSRYLAAWVVPGREDLHCLRDCESGSPMSRLQVLNTISTLAGEETKRCLGYVSRPVLLDVNALRSRFQTVVLQFWVVPAKNPPDVLKSLFAADTLQYLLNMPNEYSFWGTVQRAALFQEIMGGELPIGLRAARLGYSRLVEDAPPYLLKRSDFLTQ